MSEGKQVPVGAIISTDLTVPNAEAVRDFYKQVIGWDSEEMPMQDGDTKYADYVMKNVDGGWVGGVCHARGVNLGLPAQWLVYINVADIEASVQRCVALGGRLAKESRGEDGKLYYAVIQDPTGTYLGLTHVG